LSYLVVVVAREEGVVREGEWLGFGEHLLVHGELGAREEALRAPVSFEQFGGRSVLISARITASADAGCIHA
jgi:hypothetical protein